MVKKQDMIDFFEWLLEEEGMETKHKIPYWARVSIRNKIEDIS